ncbi:hypothetical protein H3V53_11725 [Paraburkholderia bengalensis]|uniref:Uncharacterized protein n=1 Tax=Paraburkholderia bengalensis TaxID=2747562 RepID=A0ABU8IQR0_9BURK
MQYAEEFDLPVPEEITLAELLTELENEVTAVASTDGRYLAAWQQLTPATALEFLKRRRTDIEERCQWSDDDVFDAYAEAAPIFLQDMCRVAALVEAALEEKSVDGAETTTISHTRHDSQKLNPQRQNATEWSTDLNASYDRMLSLALDVRSTKLEAPARITKWIKETSKAIEQIRASEYANRTAYLVRDTQLPSSLQTATYRKHVAIKVPDAWITECAPYLRHDAPSLAVVQRPHAAPVLVLELASGTVRLDANRLASYLLEFDTELPVLFIASDRCCLAVHRFNSLVDGAIIRDAVCRPDSHELLPRRDRLARLTDGSTFPAEERFSVFDALLTERPLTDDPDELEEIPF